MAIELFRYYLTGWHFTVVTDHASLTWLRNFRELDGMVARWIARLQPFDFAIVHRPGNHHSHADGLSRRTSRPCKRETCPECKPLRKEDTSKIKTAHCYTPTFPYQRHFDGYVEMSEEDAALFWKIDNNLTRDSGGSSIGSALTERAAHMTEEAVPETTISTRPVPSDRPDDPQCTDVCTRPAGDSRDTKPADPARLARVQERAGALSDSPLATRSSHLQATVGTQTDETTQPRIETLEENETPAILKETVIPGPMQPESKRTQREGRRRADIETPDRSEPEFDNLWDTLPFAEATWRPTYRVRAVTSPDDVDPGVHEVLDLPVLNLAVVQGENPDLVFIKELLRDHDVRPPLECGTRGIRRGEDLVDSIPSTEGPGKCLIPQEGRSSSRPRMASGGPEIPPLPDFQGLPPPRHGCSSGSSENCYSDKETFLLATNAEGRGSVVKTMYDLWTL